VAAAASGVTAHARMAAALADGAAAGLVAPFLGHGATVDRLLVQVPVTDLHPALAGVLAGRTTARRADPGPPESLTARELTILELLPTHLSYAQIGAELFLSVNTVKGNLKTVYRKLGVGSRAEAVEAARRAGLV
jgi:LuxR family maltose regulon positive regulatory protein